MSNLNLAVQLAKAIGQPIPPYWQLSAAMERLGFTASMYIDGRFVANLNGEDQAGIQDKLIVERAPVALFWQRDDGQQVIQCAKADGQSQLFWTNAAADIQSQLAYLAERFAIPQLLEGQTVAAETDPGTGLPIAG